MSNRATIVREENISRWKNNLFKIPVIFYILFSTIEKYIEAHFQNPWYPILFLDPSNLTAFKYFFFFSLFTMAINFYFILSGVATIRVATTKKALDVNLIT